MKYEKSQTITASADEPRSLPLDEWSGLEPSDKDMGLVPLTLDRGVKATLVGTVYGMRYDLVSAAFRAGLFLDHYNRRLKLLEFTTTDLPAMLDHLAWLAQANGLDKIFAKVNPEQAQGFLECGYLPEAELPGFLRGADARMVSRFLSDERRRSEAPDREDEILRLVSTPTQSPSGAAPDPAIRFLRATEDHIPALTALYRRAFASYPMPLTNPDYIRRTMRDNVLYRVAMKDGEILAAASADMDREHSNAEMTDCATNPAFRGQGLMQLLLLQLEGDLQEEGIVTPYTLARALSIGMNRTFFKLGYRYTGRMVNNCDISGQFEDMNVWIKPPIS